MSRHTGFSHISLSVADCAASVAWYTSVLDFVEITTIENPAFVERICVHESGFSLGLQQHHDREGGDFDPRRAGLDHLAFAVAERAELDAWQERLTALGVTNSPIEQTDFGAVLCLRDPDGIQLELFHMAM
ncbi:VOC family protein [Embleya sp. NPDC005575]|uniref:VOC family protein n=1 Tax=Embleya sp. NPDC005575 TaxID=3156892 RepID=UPI0033A0008F